MRIYSSQWTSNLLHFLSAELYFFMLCLKQNTFFFLAFFVYKVESQTMLSIEAQNFVKDQ